VFNKGAHTLSKSIHEATIATYTSGLKYTARLSRRANSPFARADHLRDRSNELHQRRCHPPDGVNRQGVGAFALSLLPPARAPSKMLLGLPRGRPELGAACHVWATTLIC